MIIVHLSTLKTSGSQVPSLGSLELTHRGHGSDRCAVMARSKMGYVLLTFMRMVQIDVGWWLRVFALRLDETRLKVDYVFSERIVFALNRFEVILQRVKISDLLF